MDLPGVPSALLEDLRYAASETGATRLALVGGVVRDGLLHRLHESPWRDTPDLDLVVEGDASALAEALKKRCGPSRLTHCVQHGSFGTVALTCDSLAVDLATARSESYSAPGQNPVVTPGSLRADLVRRDFTINAMALDLVSGELLDFFGGQRHLAQHQLVFLHGNSVADDPTRVIRAARYGARLSFDLANDALEQIRTTIERWPWGWQLGDSPDQAPPALATRLRMELARLLEHEPWQQALDLLERWGALGLIDPSLQLDRGRSRRLRWAHRLGLPLMPALLSGAADSVQTARRLQISGVQQQWLEQLPSLRIWLREEAPPAQAPPSQWTNALETGGWHPEVVGLLICEAPEQWRPLLRWWGRWRHQSSPVPAKDLIRSGWQPGPALGAELQRLRLAELDQGR